MQIQNCANLSIAEISALENELSGRENLRQILDWNNAVVDSIAPDEFTRDIVIKWREHLFVVFGAT